jgi:hypothetical protein
MTTKTPGTDNVAYSELAHQTMLLSRYRGYRTDAQARMDEAVAAETEAIEAETQRIHATEARIRELVAELGLK